MKNIINKFDNKIESFISDVSLIVDTSISDEICSVASNEIWNVMFMDMGDIQDAKYKR